MEVVTKLEIIDIVLSSISAKDAVNNVSDYVITKSRQELSVGHRLLIGDFFYKVKKKLNSSRYSRNKQLFISTELDWLNEVILEFHPTIHVSAPVGRPTVTYEEAKDRKRCYIRTDIKDQLREQSLEAILKAVESLSREKGNSDVAFVLRKLISDENKTAALLRKFGDYEEPTPYTAEESLSLLLDEDLTKSTYNTLRMGAIERGVNLYPSYKRLLEEKMLCRPNERPKTNEVEVEVSLNSLVHHTLKRLFELQQPVFIQYLQGKDVTELVIGADFSWGFDGSTGQSRYKQPFEDTNADDASLFATVLIPLRLSSTDASDIVFWLNPSPQYPRYCRPKHLELIKESKEVILCSYNKFMREIGSVEDYNVSLNLRGTNVLIRFVSSFHCSVIDGKVYSIITNTSSQQSCPVCAAKPSEMNNLDVLAKKRIKPAALSHGIIPLHCWIRLYDFCLHLAYRDCDGVRSWQLNTDANTDRISAEKKQQIQSDMRMRLGLLVDIPKAGGCGTTNDGNSARQAFRNHETFADILGLDSWVTKELYNLLCAISSEYFLDADLFQIACNQFLDKYLLKYSWFYIPVSLHKILIHGSQIISASSLPLGLLSEQAGESRNKFYRRDREFHARKTSRAANLLDVFNRAMDSSDPVLAHHSKAATRRKSTNVFPSEVLTLLKTPNVPVNDESQSHTVTFTTDFEDALESLQLQLEESLFEFATLGDELILWFLAFESITINKTPEF